MFFKGDACYFCRLAQRHFGWCSLKAVSPAALQSSSICSRLSDAGMAPELLRALITFLFSERYRSDLRAPEVKRGPDSREREEQMAEVKCSTLL